MRRGHAPGSKPFRCQQGALSGQGGHKWPALPARKWRQPPLPRHGLHRPQLIIGRLPGRSSVHSTVTRAQRGEGAGPRDLPVGLLRPLRVLHRGGRRGGLMPSQFAVGNLAARNLADSRNMRHGACKAQGERRTTQEASGFGVGTLAAKFPTPIYGPPNPPPPHVHWHMHMEGRWRSLGPGCEVCWVLTPTEAG